MATFDSMVPIMSAHLPGCPTPVIAEVARKMVRDLCKRAKVWRVDCTPIPLSVGVTEYALAPGLADAEAVEPIRAYIILATGNKVPLTVAPRSKVLQAFPSWPEDSPGQPSHLTFKRRGFVELANTPDAAGTLYVHASLRPTVAAATWPDDMYSEFERVVFHGVLHELMMMPDRGFTDVKAAVLHGRQWTYLLNAARARVEQEFGVAPVAVDMTPFA